MMAMWCKFTHTLVHPQWTLQKDRTEDSFVMTERPPKMCREKALMLPNLALENKGN